MNLSACSAEQLKLYWSVQQDTVIRRANLDGSQIEDVVLTPGGVIPDIAFDPVERKIYWPSPVVSGIQRAHYDGSGAETVITGLEVPTQITIDSVNRKAYWIDHGGDDSIWRSNLDGSDRELLVPFAPTANAIEVDPIHGYYYWSDAFEGKIRRTSIIDNSQSSVIFDESSLGELPLPRELAIDAMNGYLYVADDAFEAIVRMGLDGSDPVILVSEGVSNPNGIVIDQVNQRVMWSNYLFTPEDGISANISSSGFDGRDLRVEFSPPWRSGPDGFVRHLALIDVAVPEPMSLLLVAFAIYPLAVQRMNQHRWNKCSF